MKATVLLCFSQVKRLAIAYRPAKSSAANLTDCSRRECTFYQVHWNKMRIRVVKLVEIQSVYKAAWLMRTGVLSVMATGQKPQLANGCSGEDYRLLCVKMDQQGVTRRCDGVTQG